MAGRETAVIVDTFKQTVDKLCYFLVFDNTAKTTDFNITEGGGATSAFTNQPSTGPYRPISQYVKDIYGNYATPYFKSTAKIDKEVARYALDANENVFRIVVNAAGVDPVGLSMYKFGGFASPLASPPGNFEARYPLKVESGVSGVYVSDFNTIFREATRTKVIADAGSQGVITLPTIIIKEGEALKIMAQEDTKLEQITVIANDPTDPATATSAMAFNSAFLPGTDGTSGSTEKFHLLDAGTYYYYLNDPTAKSAGTGYENAQPTYDNIIYGKIIVRPQASMNQSRVPLFGPMDRLKPGKSYSGRNSMALYIDEGGKDEFTSSTYAKSLRPLFAEGGSSEKITSYHDVYYSCLRSTAGTGGQETSTDLISIPELTKKIIDGDFANIYLQPDFTATTTAGTGPSPPFTSAFRKTAFSGVDGMKIYPEVGIAETEVDIEQTSQATNSHFSRMFLGQEFTATSSAGIIKKYTYGEGTEDLPLQLVPAFAQAYDADANKYSSRIPAIGGGFFTYKSNETCPVFCMNVPKDFAVISWEFEYKQYGPGSSQERPTKSYKFVNWADTGDTTNVVFDDAAYAGTPDYFRGLNLESPPLINFLHVQM